MTNVFCDMAISLDGFVAGPDQSLDAPIGVGGMQLHQWKFDEPEAHPAEIARVTEAGAFIMGRNMFGPGRGEWDLAWEGWWGEDPPYHGPVFVLSHFARPPLETAGGTTFHFVTDGADAALVAAREAAGDRDVSIAGGASVANQYLAAGAIDELRLHVAPVLLGRGERLFDGVPHVELEPIGESTGTDRVTHLRYRVLRP